MEADIYAARVPSGGQRVLEFYKPWLAVCTRQDVSSALEDASISHDSKDDRRRRPAYDSNLTAIAELTCLRLGAQSASISLLDATQQYVLAEISEKLSLEYEHGIEDRWFDEHGRRRKDQICEIALTSTCHTVDNDGISPGLVVPDLEQDERFSQHPFATPECGIRFYAAVPIIDSDGEHIGVLAVMDNSPRKALKASELRCLQYYAKCVMRHLSLVKGNAIAENTEENKSHEASVPKDNSSPPSRKGMESSSETAMSAQAEAEEINSQQSIFMQNISHELRSPIHGILGAAQFMKDTSIDQYQRGLLHSMVTCGHTLLDTITHVLDYGKVNMEVEDSSDTDDLRERMELKRSSTTADIDVAILVEEVVESLVAGHMFAGMAAVTSPGMPSPGSEPDNADLLSGDIPTDQSGQDVKVILEIHARNTWSVRTQPGALTRVVMNLVGNALKYTPSGSILVALSTRNDEDPYRVKVVLQIEDTGIGMTTGFQKESLYLPFRQENRFEPGVGLGLSVVKRIVDSFNGSIEVKSSQHQGTAVNIGLSLPASEGKADGISEDLEEIISHVKGQHIVFLGFDEGHDKVHPIARRERALKSVATEWLGMRVSKSDKMNVEDADFYVYSEPPPADLLLEHHQITPDGDLTSGDVPLLILCTDSKEVHEINSNHRRKLNEMGRIVEVLSQPCGPRKLAKVLKLCQDQKKEYRARRERSTRLDLASPLDDKHASDEKGDEISDVREEVKDDDTENDDPPQLQQRSSSSWNGTKADVSENEQARAKDKEQSGAKKQPAEHENADQASEDKRFDLPKQSTARALVVDDNKINLRLLVTLMKKSKYPYEQAENGLEALNAYKACSEARDGKRSFDFILMDIGMPVINGIEATRQIREFETKQGLRPSLIIALTAWGDIDTRKEAEAVGMDVFIPKPVQFEKLIKMLKERLQKDGDGSS